MLAAVAREIFRVANAAAATTPATRGVGRGARSLFFFVPRCRGQCGRLLLILLFLLVEEPHPLRRRFLRNGQWLLLRGIPGRRILRCDLRCTWPLRTVAAFVTHALLRAAFRR